MYKYIIIYVIKNCNHKGTFQMAEYFISCVDSQGRITLPKVLRQYFNIEENDILAMRVEEHGILLEKTRAPQRKRKAADE